MGWDQIRSGEGQHASSVRGVEDVIGDDFVAAAEDDVFNDGAGGEGVVAQAILDFKFL